MTLQYIDIYKDARRKMTPVDSILYTISDAKNTHPSLKQFYGQDNNNLIGSIMRSLRVLIHCIQDIDDFTKQGIKEATVNFVREMFIRAHAHLAHYLGVDTINLFISEMTDTPLLELEYGKLPSKEKMLEMIESYGKD